MTKKTFEEAITELEEIVYKLESSELPLDETIDKYKQADELIKCCEKLLSEAEAGIKQIKLDGSEETVVNFVGEVEV